jgi:hypothetical protein
VSGKAVELIFAMSGKGRCEGDVYDRNSLIELASGESAGFRATTDTELLRLSMPLVGTAAGRKAA